jgi:2-amino-4-hydroxy-6-hydroxymethyldihydropteridine diphosphokinase
MTHENWAYISVGSNLGDPLDNCRRGIDALCDGQSVALAAASPFYKTEPVDYLDQDWFVNAAIKVFTDLDPMALLSRIQEVQGRMGRKASGIRFGPRILDLDIIFYRDLVLKNERLVIPHPRMHKRRFVLQPICDIDPTIVHPEIGLDVQTILNQLVTDGQEITLCSSGC